ncbi:MAG: hypothetical protein CME70_00435 [Halobacteriovorax sp.]|nr:hypothetical protein [Halobacteriovorax sp.]|tara:strand:+ start:37307 stop:38146 length:840 start_codon:yes stop_codon:yes gene_type:complete
MQNYIAIDLPKESLKTAYLEVGDKSLPTILFIHGNSSSKETFKKQASSLKNSYHLIAVDLPGHGGTEALKNSKYSLSLFKEFLLSFIRALDLEVHTLMGHSLGGHICLQTMNSISAQRLILWGTPPMTNPPVMEKMFAPNPSSALLFKNELNEEELQKLYESCFSQRSSQGFLEYSEAFRKTDHEFREGFFQEFTKLLYQDEFLELDKFPGQVLFIHGKEEKLINKGYLVENCIDFQVELVEGAGHFTHLDAPDLFNMACLKFLSTNSKNINLTMETSY